MHYRQDQLVGRPPRTSLEIRGTRLKPDAIAQLIRAELKKLGGADVTVQLDT